tara:strand:- start:396216 stop:396794 length:579 start_codon:yes stop_codon:yes gene_type:complete
MKGYLKLRKKSLEILHSELSDNLHYHGIDHTLDVLNVCNQYIKRDKIDSRNAKLLRIGALLHDIGFTVSNINHEMHGVEIAKKLMEEFEFSQRDFSIVKGLILATKIPQKPQSNLEKIICDADLDYLGRPDYYKIANRLFKELKAYTEIETLDEWNSTQIKFLQAHNYHTKFALKRRKPQKEKRITELKKLG